MRAKQCGEKHVVPAAGGELFALPIVSVLWFASAAIRAPRASSLPASSAHRDPAFGAARTSSSAVHSRVPAASVGTSATGGGIAASSG